MATTCSWLYGINKVVWCINSCFYCIKYIPRLEIWQSKWQAHNKTRPGGQILLQVIHQLMTSEPLWLKMCPTEPWQEHIVSHPTAELMRWWRICETYQSCRTWIGSIYWFLNFRSMNENMLRNFETWYIIRLIPTSETSLQVYILTALVEWAVCIALNSVYLWCTAMWPAKGHKQTGTETWLENLWLVHIWNTCW